MKKITDSFGTLDKTKVFTKIKTTLGIKGKGYVGLWRVLPYFKNGKFSGDKDEARELATTSMSGENSSGTTTKQQGRPGRVSKENAE
jgi:hypothetical protein